MSEVRLFSQPVLTTLSQLPKPVLQVTEQAPAEHDGDEFG